MLILHVSDIHFRYPHCADRATDPDSVYRTAMAQDIEAQVRDRGPVAAILVGGDIAFKADPEEYAYAQAWLLQLARIAKCDASRILVVPGNHDIDRSITAKQHVCNVHAGIARADDRERALRRTLDDETSRNSLFAPLAAYNGFAAQFNCQLYWPERLYWVHDLALEHGVYLRIHGLNSTLLSGPEGGNDRSGDLYISPLQTVLETANDVVNAVFAHHPPDWCEDKDEVSDAFDARASLHIFGHRHRQRVMQTEHYMRLSAAAVNPERNEQGFEPGYNFIEARAELRDGQKQVVLRAFARRWQAPDMFVPRFSRAGNEWHEQIIPVRSSGLAPSALTPAEPATAAGTPVDVIDGFEVELEMSENSARDYIFRFWQLRTSQRKRICEALGVYDAADATIPEPERFGRALERIASNNLIERFGDELARMESGK